MHMQGEPRTMQQAPHYDDVVSDVRRSSPSAFSPARCPASTRSASSSIPVSASARRSNTISALLRALDQFSALGVPLLAGLSRKGIDGTLTGRENPADRAAGSAAAALLAVQKGAAIVRVHDVAQRAMCAGSGRVSPWHPRREESAEGIRLASVRR
jgi:dihydropteroate synthase